MPKLVIHYKGKTVQELELSTERVTIGRGEGNTVKFDDPQVSRNHAEIREEGGRYFLSDLGSANGTYVGAKRISRDYELKDGDIIKISPYTIFFRLSPSEKPTQLGRVETGEKPTEIFTFSGAPRVLVRSGAEVGQIYDLSNNPLIGRDSECDIVLSEPSVSRRHARIQFIDNKLSIMDVGSKSGTRVNGKLIDKPTNLKDGDRIQLGEVILEVEWKGAPKIEAEKPTVPVFRPEPMAVKKSEAWKWPVGIGAAVIVVFGVVYLFITSWSPGANIEDAEILYEEGCRNSDTVKLKTAERQVKMILKVKSSERAKRLYEAVQQKILDIKDSRRYTAEAQEMVNKKDYLTAINYTTWALEKDSNNLETRDLKIRIHKLLATKYEIEGNKAKQYGNWHKANELYHKAKEQLKEVIALNATDAEAIEKISEIELLIAPGRTSEVATISRSGKETSITDSVKEAPKKQKEPVTKSRDQLYKEAFDAYRQMDVNSVQKAEKLVNEILKRDSTDIEALKLYKNLISIALEAFYKLELRAETVEARQLFEELYNKDPGNVNARRWVEKLSKKGR